MAAQKMDAVFAFAVLSTLFCVVSGITNLRLHQEKHFTSKQRAHNHFLRRWATPAFRTEVQQASVTIPRGSGGNDDPVEGDVWPVAIFWTEIGVGTPAAKFPVAIDSGSDTLDIPHANCQTCIHKSPNNAYSANSSSTSKPIACGFGCTLLGGGCSGSQCAFSNTYGTCDLKNPDAPCTIKGLWYTDQVSIGSIGSVPIDFGAITFQTSNFDQFKNIDGVMGMAGPSGATNVFQTLVDNGKLPKAVWALCLVHGSTSNGTLTLGGLDSRLYTGAVKYVDDVGTSEGFYGVSLQSISVAGHSVPNTGSSMVILDSGTNVLLTPTPVFDQIKSAFQALCSSKPLKGVCNATSGHSLFDGSCYHFTQAEMAMFPKVALNLNGVSLEMDPSDYLLLGEEAGDVYCFGIRNTGSDGYFIIGDTTIKNYYVVFDRVNNQIGWAPVNNKNCGSL